MTYVILRRNEEEGLGRVEGHAHHPPSVLAEGVLASAARQLMDKNRLHGNKKRQC